MSRLGRYELLEEIASGGQGVVYRGRLVGPGGFARKVAIKRLLPVGLAEGTRLDALLREARLAALVRHPNVAAVLDVGVEGDEPYLVMEYIEGVSLARVQDTHRDRGEPLPLDIATTIVAAMLNGLHAAHEACGPDGRPLGIVHRDVAPQNALVGWDGVVRLIDFGIARATTEPRLTRAGVVRGRFAYLAPEQIEGALSPKVDVYAASAVLWELLTGRRLVTALTAEDAFAEILFQPVRSPRELRAEVPTDLEAIVMKGLARSPSARFPTARAMAQALETWGVLAPAALAEWLDEHHEPDVPISRESRRSVGTPLLPAEVPEAPASSMRPRGIGAFVTRARARTRRFLRR